MIKSMPKLVGETGNMCFELEDGTKTKSFYSAGKLNYYNGMYSIYDKDENIVEYMNMFGKFSKKETEFAKCLHDYLTYEFRRPIILRAQSYTAYYCALIHFPSKFLVDEKMRNFVVEEEKRKYQYLINHRMFVSMLERLLYKRYVKSIIREKFKKAKYLSTKPELVECVNSQIF